jgi:photosystem II stability/assembly factor-like uncharacterized protein
MALLKYYIILFLFIAGNPIFSQNFWKKIDSPTDNFLRTLHFADSLRGWVGGDSGSIFYTSDGGNNWIQQQTNTNSKIMRIFFLDDNKAWALAWAEASVRNEIFFGTEILKTTDGGLNWTVEQYNEEYVFLRGIYFLDSLKGFAGGEPSKFLQTSDGGINWVPANLDSGTFADFPVIDFKFYNELYGYAYGGRFDIAGVVWRTTNGGDFWTSIDTSFAPADPINDIHFFDSIHVMGVCGDPELLYGIGFLNSADAGVTWDYFEIEVLGKALAVSFRTENEGWIVVPVTETLVATFDHAENWIEYPSPDSSRLYDIVFTDSLTGYAVGEEGVILKYKYQKPNNIEEEKSLLADFVLYQNYPNPFNPFTTISYNLAEAGFVVLKIYNTLGNQICTLVNEHKSVGNYKVQWNADGNPSGVYFIKLDVNGKLMTKKIMLLK